MEDRARTECYTRIVAGIRPAGAGNRVLLRLPSGSGRGAPEESRNRSATEQRGRSVATTQEADRLARSGQSIGVTGVGEPALARDDGNPRLPGCSSFTLPTLHVAHAEPNMPAVRGSERRSALGDRCAQPRECAAETMDGLRAHLRDARFTHAEDPRNVIQLEIFEVVEGEDRPFLLRQRENRLV